MGRGTSKQRNVCIGGRTALRIVRELGVEALEPLDARINPLPKQQPSEFMVSTGLNRLETTLPISPIRRPAYIMARSNEKRRTSLSREPHSCKCQLFKHSFYKALPGVYVCSTELAFIQTLATMDLKSNKPSTASVSPQDRTLHAIRNLIPTIELACELCGTYQTDMSSNWSAYNVAPITSVNKLLRYAKANSHLSGSVAAIQGLKYAMDLSASPRETKLALLLGLPMNYGGYGLGVPKMNFEVTADYEAKVSAGRWFFKCDLCWPEAKLDVEYQSREIHSNEISRINDSKRTNALLAMGWQVVQITNEEVDALTSMDTAASSIRKHLGKRSGAKHPDYRRRQIELRRALGLPMR